MNRSLQYSTKDYWLNFFLIAFFIFPQSEVLYYAVPIGMFALTDWRKQTSDSLMLFVWLIIFLLGASLLVNISQSWVDAKSYLKAIQFIVCLLSFGRLKSLRIMKGTLVFLVFYLAIFQFAGVFNISAINNLSSILYPLTDKTEAVFESVSEMEMSGIGYNTRLFGIYRNSNNCALYWEILLLLLISERDILYQKRKDSILYIALLLFSLWGIVAAGSRTSFLVLIAIAVMYFTVSNTRAKFSVLIPLTVFMAILFIFGRDMRMFQVEEGMSDSFGMKMTILSRYISTDLDALSFLFGRFTTKALVPLLNTMFAGTDCDFGDMFVRYGILSFVAWLSFLIFIFNKIDKNNRVFFCIFLWIFSNTILVNFRTSTILLLVLSIYYSRKQSIIS